MRKVPSISGYDVPFVSSRQIKSRIESFSTSGDQPFSCLNRSGEEVDLEWIWFFLVFHHDCDLNIFNLICIIKSLLLFIITYTVRWRITITMLLVKFWLVSEFLANFLASPSTSCHVKFNIVDLFSYLPRLVLVLIYPLFYYVVRGCHGRDRMVVGFTITCTINPYYH